MTFRRFSWALVVLGLAVGSWADRGAAPAPAREGEYWVLAADFHVHGFFGDGALPPWEIRAEARRRGLDVVALTNHNQRFAHVVDRWFSRRNEDPLILRAEEITAQRYHLIAIGAARRVGWNQPAAAAIAEIHAAGGAAIAAHPIRLFWPGFDAESMAMLDGAEIAHPLMIGGAQPRAELEEFFRTAERHHNHLSPIGSTDFHFEAPMGRCRTYVFARAATSDAVVEAVRSGRTVAYDVDGRGQGDPQLVAVTDRIFGAADAGRHRNALATTGSALALLGFAGLSVGEVKRR